MLFNSTFFNSTLFNGMLFNSMLFNSAQHWSSSDLDCQRRNVHATAHARR